MAAIKQGGEAHPSLGMGSKRLVSTATCPEQGSYAALHEEPHLGLESVGMMFAIGHDHEGVHAMTPMLKYRAEQDFTGIRHPLVEL